MKQIHKYRFVHKGVLINNRILPSFSPRLFYKNHKHIYENRHDFEIYKDIVVSPLIPKFYGEFPPEKVDFLGDVHGWIEDRILGTSFIFSQKVKEFIENYKLSEYYFYSAQVEFEENLVPYYIFYMKTQLYFDNLIDYRYSTFVKYGKQTEEKVEYTVENEKELKSLQIEHDWNKYDFGKRIMKPRFEDIDLICTKHYGYLISEKLKNALEKTDFIGYKIKPEPIVFEIAEEGI